MTKWRKEPQSGPTVVDREATLEALSTFHEGVRHAEYELALAVHQARLAGLSWTEVGIALGMSKQGAQQAFSDGVGYPDHLAGQAMDRKLGIQYAVVRWRVQNQRGTVLRVFDRQDDAHKHARGLRQKHGILAARVVPSVEFHRPPRVTRAMWREHTEAEEERVMNTDPPEPWPDEGESASTAG